jgi:hypothetical protein
MAKAIRSECKVQGNSPTSELPITAWYFIRRGLVLLQSLMTTQACGVYVKIKAQDTPGPWIRVSWACQNDAGRGVR